MVEISEPSLCVKKLARDGEGGVYTARVKRWVHRLDLSKDRLLVDGRPLWPVPVFPQSGKREGPPVAEANVERLLGPALLLPLVEPVRQDQAPAFAKGRSKGGLGRGGLGLGVDPPLVSSLAWGSASSL